MMDDLISRQAAIEALDALCDRECEYSKKQRSVMCGACHLGSAFDIIEQLPTAEPRKGEWVITDDKYIDVSKCSECGAVEYFNKGWKRFNFCPNCGAKMEESE